MSHRVSQWAWQQRPTGAKGTGGAGPKLVLVALADLSDHEGFSRPGTRYLASMCGLSPDTTREYVRLLEHQGYVSRESRYRDGRQTSNGYQLAVESPADVEHGEPPQEQPASGGGDPSSPRGGDPSSGRGGDPSPPGTRQQDPSAGPPAREGARESAPEGRRTEGGEQHDHEPGASGAAVIDALAVVLETQQATKLRQSPAKQQHALAAAAQDALAAGWTSGQIVTRTMADSLAGARSIAGTLRARIQQLAGETPPTVAAQAHKDAVVDERERHEAERAEQQRARYEGDAALAALTVAERNALKEQARAKAVDEAPNAPHVVHLARARDIARKLARQGQEPASNGDPTESPDTDPPDAHSAPERALAGQG